MVVYTNFVVKIDRIIWRIFVKWKMSRNLISSTYGYLEIKSKFSLKNLEFNFKTENQVIYSKVYYNITLKYFQNFLNLFLKSLLQNFLELAHHTWNFYRIYQNSSVVNPTWARKCHYIAYNAKDQVVLAWHLTR